MYGKTLENYAITAVVEKEEVKKAQKTFTSSTFWTERIGPAAAIKPEVMEKQIMEIITEIGKSKKHMD